MLAAADLSHEEYWPIPTVDPYDLGSLRYEEPYYDAVRNKWIFVTPERVLDFVDQINSLDANDTHPFAITIGCGGTPTMTRRSPNGPLEPSFNTEQLMAKTDPRVRSDYRILCFDALAMDSSQGDIDDVGDLVIAMHYMWDHMSLSLRQRFMGFALIEGTDTQQQADAHMAMMYGHDQSFPIVVFGTQKSTEEDPEEFKCNSRDALDLLYIMYLNSVVDSLTIMGRLGVLTVGKTIVSNTKPQAFDSLLHQPVIDMDTVMNHKEHRLPGWLRKASYGDVDRPPVVYRGINRVGVLEARVAENLALVDSLIDSVGCVAILLTTYHTGTFDARTMERFKVLIDKRPHKIPVFALNPVASNDRPSLETYAASAEWMRALDVELLLMTQAAAEAKIMRLVAEEGRQADNPRHPSFRGEDEEYTAYMRHHDHDWNRSRVLRIRAAMQHNLVGEIPTLASARSSG